MIQEKIVRDTLLYHSAHGLCRVDELIREMRSGKEVLSYALVPKLATKMKVRFVVSDLDMEMSGFHPLVSVKEANEILEYLKAGEIETALPAKIPQSDDHSAQENHPWNLAKGILSLSSQNFEIKDQRKRQILRRFAKGLVGEFAFVFKMTLKETSLKIRKSLGGISKINPLVLDALEQAVHA